jgi:hypothetical protein
MKDTLDKFCQLINFYYDFGTGSFSQIIPHKFHNFCTRKFANKTSRDQEITWDLQKNLKKSFNPMTSSRFTIKKTTALITVTSNITDIRKVENKHLSCHLS